MFTIEVHFLPKQTEEELLRLYDELWGVLEGIPQLGLSRDRPEEAWIHFPVDALQYGLGYYLKVEVTQVPTRLGRPRRIQDRLAEGLGAVIRKWFPNAKFVEVTVTEKRLGDLVWKYDGQTGRETVDTDD